MVTTVSRQDSLFYTHQLPNGLQMLGQLMPDVQSAAAIFWVRTGTRDESPKEMGVSHFLEHMAFRRTKSMTGEEIDRSFEELGADHNAGTWKEMTFYWARVLAENVSAVIQILAELTQPILEAKDFDHERNVILEEIARYEDIPSHVLITHLMKNYFGSHPLAMETLGTTETIKALNVEAMRQYWRERYGTENILFAIAGNFDWESVVAEVETLTGGWGRGSSNRATESARAQPGFHVYQRNKFQQEQIGIATETVSGKDPRFYVAAALSTILGDDSGSRLFWALHQTGLAETATSQIIDFEDNGVLLVHVATEPALAEQALEKARQVMRETQERGVEPAELERAKAKLISSVIIGGESTNERVMALINSWLMQGRLETLEEIRQRIEAVSVDDIRELLNAYPLAPNQVVTAVGPMSEGQLQGAA